ncbi:MAG: hypothetical protein BM564_13590 [Bacteroidetes bacterium MedPE-SWsnd-G2]|nr:MAG: hypothetical protein BM564_13590 [Bacteroidetes bacterium MedPE-SWsnd-G2]
MIKFFRKIRQDLLSKGKTGKYFKYAVGEIVLVVIGILIALQINNWNTQRVQEIDVENYLIRLKTEYEYNIERANYLIRDVEEHSIEVQLNLVDSVKNIFLNGIDSGNYKSILNPDLYWYNQFRMQRDVHDEGAKTGILFKIQNSELLNEIQKHHAIMNGRKEWVGKSLYRFNACHDKAVGFKFMREWTNGIKDISEHANSLEYKTIVKNNSWLLNIDSEEYQLAFLSIDKFREFLISRYGFLATEIEGTTKLISLINKELEK